MAAFLEDASTGFSICPQVIHYGPSDPPVVIRGSEGPISLRSFVSSRIGIDSLPVSPGARLSSTV